MSHTPEVRMRVLDPKKEHTVDRISFLMNRIRSLPIFLVVLALLLAAGCLQEQNMRPEPTPGTSHEDMQQHLGNMTRGIRAVLDIFDITASDAAGALGTTGLTGPEADEILAEAAASHPSVISAITFDSNGTVLSAEPASAHVVIGENILDQTVIHTTISTKNPVMGELFTLRQGGKGVGIGYPVFSANGTVLGGFSLTFSPNAMITPLTEEAMAHAPYTYIVAQPDGLLLYHINPAMVGKETFNDTAFTEFPEVLELARQYSTNRTGYITFAYYAAGSTKIVPKETFWDTVMLHGTEWRVLVIREM